MLGGLFRTKQVPSDHPVKINEQPADVVVPVAPRAAAETQMVNVRELASRFDRRHRDAIKAVPLERTVSGTFDDAFGSYTCDARVSKKLSPQEKRKQLLSI